MGERGVIYWFSGTGNSRWVAGRLADLLGDCELVPVVRAMKEQINPAPIVGIVFPVYGFGPPIIVAEFVARLAAPDSYVFSLATMGGMAGASHAIIRNRLKNAGTTLSAGWSVQMPGNCISLSQAPDPGNQNRMFEKADARLPEIARSIASRERRRPQDSLPPVNWISHPIWKWAIKHFPTGDRKFLATDACVHCGLCARICPAGNIKPVEGRPTWLGHCQQCYGCINVCPRQAIQVGKSTVGRRRFWHPQVTHEQMAEQARYEIRK